MARLTLSRASSSEELLIRPVQTTTVSSPTTSAPPSPCLASSSSTAWLPVVESHGRYESFVSLDEDDERVATSSTELESGRKEGGGITPNASGLVGEQEEEEEVGIRGIVDITSSWINANNDKTVTATTTTTVDTPHAPQIGYIGQSTIEALESLPALSSTRLLATTAPIVRDGIPIFPTPDISPYGSPAIEPAMSTVLSAESLSLPLTAEERDVLKGLGERVPKTLEEAVPMEEGAEVPGAPDNGEGKTRQRERAERRSAGGGGILGFVPGGRRSFLGRIKDRMMEDNLGQQEGADTSSASTAEQKTEVDGGVSGEKRGAKAGAKSEFTEVETAQAEHVQVQVKRTPNLFALFAFAIFVAWVLVEMVVGMLGGGVVKAVAVLCVAGVVVRKMRM